MEQDPIIGFDALYASMMKCKKGVLWKDSAAHYVLNGIEETLKLENELKTGTYKARKPRYFVLTSPKRRDAISISFRDRVFQRSLNDNSIYQQLTKSLIYDNAACQKNKGTNFARERLTCFLQKHYRKYGCEGYVLQCDISGYYRNMRHDVAENYFKKHLDERTFEMAKKILLEQYPGEIGYAPGSQMIQLAGIAVLSDMDHYIKERLKAKYYVRYMDDFLIISNDKEYLMKAKAAIEGELSKIGFTLHPKKTHISELRHGIDFLGFTYTLTSTGKVVKTVISQNVKQYRKKLRRLVGLAKKGVLTREKVDECYRSWRAHCERGDSHKMLRRMDDYYKNLW